MTIEGRAGRQAPRYNRAVRKPGALTPKEFERAAERLRHPAPGSRIAAAQEHRIDWTLLIERLGLTPAEHLKRLEGAASRIERLRKSVQKRR